MLGFIVIIGEMGFGKFILLGVLNLICGECVDYSVICNQEEKIIVEVEFWVYFELEFWFLNNDIDFGFEVILWCEIFVQGKLCVFINDSLVQFF